MDEVRYGDKVRSLVNQFDVYIGREYVVTAVDENGFVDIIDDAGEEYGLSSREYTFEYEGSLIHDTQGASIRVGDTIAYAFAGSAFRHLALFEVQSISGRTAVCRAKADGAVITLGVFEERAIKV